MGKKNIGPQTDPSTVAGSLQDPSEAGGGFVQKDVTLANVYQENRRPGSSWQQYEGIMNTLNAIETPQFSSAIVKDPANPERAFVKIGGEGSVQEEAPVHTFNHKTMDWQPNRYPDISENVALGDASVLGGPAAGVEGSRIFATAGGDDPDYNNNIYVLDTSGSATWTETSDTLGTAVAYPGWNYYDGKIYLFGGTDPTNSPTSDLQIIDMTASEGSRVTVKTGVLPAPFEESGRMPIVNGEIYLSGGWGGSESTASFFKYNFADESFTKLTSNNATFYEGGSPGDGGGVLPGHSWEHNGWIWAPSGNMYHGGVDFAAYSIEKDNWYSVYPDLPIYGSVYETAVQGNWGAYKVGSVLFVPQGYARGGLWAYTIPDDPTEYGEAQP